jgi:hypothetical protein
MISALHKNSKKQRIIFIPNTFSESCTIKYFIANWFPKKSRFAKYRRELKKQNCATKDVRSSTADKKHLTNFSK